MKVLLSLILLGSIAVAQQAPSRREFPTEGMETSTVELIAREQQEILKAEEDLKKYRADLDARKSKLSSEVAMVHSFGYARLGHVLVPGGDLGLSYSVAEENKGRIVWVEIAPVGSTGK